ncbi:MAG TPA: hypothetical protein DCM27_05740, partial [Rhodospirillaceae bacterium]|nr:hypothetical protein [Rhodospirillaceae bacterium]
FFAKGIHRSDESFITSFEKIENTAHFTPFALFAINLFNWFKFQPLIYETILTENDLKIKINM